MVMQMNTGYRTTHGKEEVEKQQPIRPASNLRI